MAGYLVTGGCGFIGAHLVRALRERGHAVRVLDNLFTGHEACLPAGVQFVRGDVTDTVLLRRALDGADGCFHMAGVASVAGAPGEWLAAHRVNLTGTLSLFEAMRRRGGAPCPLVWASSAAIYGEAGQRPLAENAPKSPISAYGADKLAAEIHAQVAARQFGAASIALRFFNVYGEGQDIRVRPSGVIAALTRAAVRNEPAPLFGNGGQIRDFIHVRDAATACLAAMARAQRIVQMDRPPRAEAFNICSGRGTSIADLIAMIAELTGTYPAIRRLPERQGDIRRSVGANSAMIGKLGVAPSLPLRAGLRALCDRLVREAACGDIARVA